LLASPKFALRAKVSRLSAIASTPSTDRALLQPIHGIFDIMLRVSLAAVTYAALIYMHAPPAGATTLAAWSQYGERGEVEARLVTDESACPDLIADARSVPMRERAPPNQAFPVRICVAAIPVGTKRLTGGGMDLPVPVRHPHHIVVFGDTGCRLKGAVVQACNDPVAWPFHAIAERAAQAHPDLMIHLGDYLYRETPCRAQDKRCTGTPWGDNWATWNADFFAPAAPLLHRTVWLMTRGNHEDCSRAGGGFTELLGHDSRTTGCNPHESPLLVDLDGVKLALLDDNAALDNEIAADVADVLRRDIAVALAAKVDWLVSHHPFRGISKPHANREPGVMEGANATLLAALSGTDESQLTLMLAGHIHSFQIENYHGATAPQLIVGEGGDALDTEVPRQLAGLVSGGETIAAGLSVPGFGYVVLDRGRRIQDWTITVHAVDGSVLRRCALASRKLACATESRQNPPE
jgi:Calcineurin-like phosphoesterase